MVVLLLTTSLASTARADKTALYVLPLSYRAAEEIAPLIAPLLEPDEGVVAAGDRLLLRAGNDTLDAVKNVLPTLDRRRASLLLRLRLLTRSATSSAGGLDSVEVRLGSQRSSARALVIGPSDRHTKWRSESSARVIEGSATWIATRDVELTRTSPSPSLAIVVQGRRPPPTGKARIDLIQAPRAPLLRATGSMLRIVPRLRGDEVVAQIGVYGSSPELSGGINEAGYGGQVVAPLNHWIALGAVNEVAERQVAGPGYPGATADNRQHELWVRFERVPEGDPD